MGPLLDSAVIAELKPAIRALASHGFQIVAIEGGGKTFSATFRSDNLSLLVVKDRAFWHIGGTDNELKAMPSRKTQAAAIKDALAWITRNDA
jgi:hypothetical protein